MKVNRTTATALEQDIAGSEEHVAPMPEQGGARIEEQALLARLPNNGPVRAEQSSSRVEEQRLPRALGMCHNCGERTGKNAWRAMTRRGWVDACTGCFWEKRPGKRPGIRGAPIRDEIGA